MSSDGIEEVLALYGLENAAVELLRHNENRTYRVDCKGRSFCLRLKKAIPGFDLSIFGSDTEKLLREELRLLQAIGKTDIPVQQPVPSLCGDMIAKLSDGTLASLLTWLDGEPLNAGERTDAMLFSAGCTLANLSNIAEKSPVSPALSLFSYDQKLVERLIGKAEAGSAYLPADVIRSIVRALDTVSRVMDEMDCIEPLRIAHADPGFGNLIWNGSHVGLIDWSLAGYAHSYMDLGGLMSAASGREEQQLILRGWENIRGKAERRYLDAYFSLSVLLFVCCQYTRAGEWSDWYPSALLRWQTTIFDPLSEGKPIPGIL